MPWDDPTFTSGHHADLLITYSKEVNLKHKEYPVSRQSSDHLQYRGRLGMTGCGCVSFPLSEIGWMTTFCLLIQGTTFFNLSLTDFNLSLLAGRKGLKVVAHV